MLLDSAIVMENPSDRAASLHAVALINGFSPALLQSAEVTTTNWPLG